MTAEWHLPKFPIDILLDRDELLVLDWFLCGHYLTNVSRGSDIGEIIGTWHILRMEVWAGIQSVSKPTSPVVATHCLPMDEGTAKYLFNWLPPTFMWGTGRDCGFSLKMKLHRFLAGEEDLPNDNQNATESNPKDAPSTYP